MAVETKYKKCHVVSFGRNVDINYKYRIIVDENNQMMELERQDKVQESRAIARKPRDAAAILFGLKFADNIHYEFKSQASTEDPQIFRGFQICCRSADHCLLFPLPALLRSSHHV